MPNDDKKNDSEGVEKCKKDLRKVLEEDLVWFEKAVSTEEDDNWIIEEKVVKEISDKNYEKYWSIVEKLMSMRIELSEDRNDIRKKAVVDNNNEEKMILLSNDGNKNNNMWERYDFLELFSERIQMRLDRLVDIWEEQLKEEEENVWCPRIIVLCKGLELNREELWALHFVVLHHVGQKFPPLSSRMYWERGIIRNMAICCPSLSSPIKALRFLSPQRLHIEQGIIKINDDSYLDLSNISFSMDQAVLSCIIGNPLTLEEKLTIDGTLLAQILEKEDLVKEEKVEEELVKEEKEEEEEVVIMQKEEPVVIIESNNDIYEEMDDLIKKESRYSSIQQNEEDIENSDDINKLTPFEDDLDYLKDYFKYIAAKLDYMYADMEDESHYRLESKNKCQTLREKSALVKTTLLRAKGRLELTMTLYKKNESKFCPRLEKFSLQRNLQEFEKLIIITLIGAVLSSDILKLFHQTHKYRQSLTVGELLWLHFKDLKDQISHRHYFYKTATLVKERIIFVQEKNMTSSDLVGCAVEIDRRVLDYILRLDTELNCLVENTHLVTPSTTMDQVVLPSKIKRLILQTVNNAFQMEHIVKQLDLQDTFEYGRGTVLLLHGRSGVGKTMLASALANYLNKKILLATLISNADTLVDDLKLVFREARIQDSIVFLDECEGLLESRSIRNVYSINRVLTEMEQFDGLLILATNRVNDLDEALHRRITLSVEIPLPDAKLREEIWRVHIPSKVHLDEDVDFAKLATEFELSGGFIKNAILMALLNSKKDDNEYRLTKRELEESCLTQIRGQLELDSNYECILPQEITHSLNCLKGINPDSFDILKRAVAEFQLRHLIGSSPSPCISILVLGSCQSGKTHAIRALAAECRRPLVSLCLSDLIQKHRQNKETSVFRDVFHSGAMLHFEIFGVFSDSLESPSSLAIHIISKVLNTFKGIIAIELTCSNYQQQQWMRGNRKESINWFAQLVQKVGYITSMDPPTSTQQDALAMWKICLNDDSIDCTQIARLYPLLTIGEIQKVIRQARVHALSVNKNELDQDSILIAASWLQDKYRIAGAPKPNNVMYS